jgi:hypothetical protein
MLSVKIQNSSQTGQPLYWKEGKIFKILFTITPTNVNSGANANPYVAGGDTLDLTQLMGLLAGAPGSTLPTFEAVAKVEIQSVRPQGAANSANLFVYSYAPGTTLANGTMQVFTGAAAQTALTELTAGNYPAGVTTDTIQGEAYFVMP